MRRGFMQTAEGQLHYRRCGTGEPFVLLITLPFDTTMFLPLMEVLGQSHDCIAVDLMGQGDSDKRRRAWDCRDHAVALLAGLDDLGIGSFRLLGGHFSGQVAIEAAILAPTRVKTLFIDGAVGWSLDEGRELAKRWPHAPSILSAAYVAEQWDYVQALFRRLDPEFEYRSANSTRYAELAFAFITMFVGDPAGQSMFDYDLPGRVALLTVPTVLIGSPTDTLRSQHETVLAAIPSGRESLFAGVNPLYQFDKPERAAEYAEMLTRLR